MRTLRALSLGTLLIALTACTAGAPSGVVLPPLTASAASVSETATETSTPAATPEVPTLQSPTSESATPIESTAPVDITVPPEASALPLPTEQINVPADNPQEEADRAAIEAVWRQVWDLYRNGYEMTETDIRDRAAQLMTDPLQSRMVNGLLSPESRAASATGDVVLHPYWYEPVGNADYAVIGDCSDFSQMTVADRGTGDNATTGRANVNTVGHFLRGPDGNWRVWEVTDISTSACVAS